MNCVCIDQKTSKNETNECYKNVSSDVEFCFDLSRAPYCCNTCYDLQCQHVYGKNAIFVSRTLQTDLRTNSSYICSSLPCYLDHNIIKVIAAAPGTICGSGKICLHGKCVSHLSAPYVTESCLFGDDSTFEYNNIKCNDLNQTTKHFCYMTKIKQSCCQTCQKFYLPLIDDYSPANQTLTFTEQCAMINNNQSSLCVRNSMQYTTSICTSLSCTIPGNDICELFLVATGTKCGDDKVCLRGDCQLRSSIIEERNYLTYVIGTVLCAVVSMATGLGIYLIKIVENSHSSVRDDTYEYVDLDLRLLNKTERSEETIGSNEQGQELEDNADQYVYPGGSEEILTYTDEITSVLTQTDSRENYGEDHYVYPGGSEEILTYNDEITSVLTQTDSRENYGEGASSQLKDADVTSSVAPGLYRNMYHCPDVSEGDVTSIDYNVPVQRSNSDYICPLDYVHTEKWSLETQSTYLDIKQVSKPNTWPKRTGHWNISVTKQTVKVKSSWSDMVGRMKRGQGTDHIMESTRCYTVSIDGQLCGTGLDTDYITPVDGVDIYTDGQLCRSALDTDYITPVDGLDIYTDGQLCRSGLDTDYITPVDGLDIYTDGQLCRNALNTDYITPVDGVDIYTDGQLCRSGLDTDYITPVDGVDIYTDGQLCVSGLDTDYITLVDAKN